MSTSWKHLDIERSEEGVLEIRLHTEGGPFLWAEDSAVELCEAFGAIARDPTVRIVILTGTGDVFCGQGMVMDPFPTIDARGWETVRWYGEQLLMNLLGIQAPVIACINGPVIMHPEIPLLSDIVLAAEDTVIQDAGHFTVNATPSDGLHIFMPLLMGLTRARYFLITGQKLSVEEAKTIGLVNEILPRAELLPRARELALAMMDKNPLVLRYTRLALTHQLKGLCHDMLGYGGALEGLAVIDQGART